MPTIKTHHQGDMVFETEAGGHRILNDVMQTPEWGGKGRHPTPPDYFLTSISSCIGAFVVQYCDRAGLNTDGLEVELSFEKCEDPVVYLKDLAVNIHLPNAEVGGRVEALRRAAQVCVVHETIARMGSELNVRITDKTSG